GRAPGQQVALQIVEGEPAVDDVLDHQYMAVGQVDVQVLHDADHTRGAGGAAVGGHRHKVHLDREVDGAGQVAHEHERPLEHPDQQGRPPAVVGRDPPA